MLRMRVFTAAAFVIGGAALAQSRQPSQEIGSWVLTCAGAKSAPCQLRDQTPILQAGDSGLTASLEVMHRGGLFVPVIALRGMSMQAALGGALVVQPNVNLQFDNLPAIDLACGLDGSAVLCTPVGGAVLAAAAALPEARNAVVQVRISLPGPMTLPEQSRSLDLRGTRQALAEFRATAPASESVPVIAGLDWRGFLDRMARDAGFRNGLADVVPSGTALIDGHRP